MNKVDSDRTLWWKCERQTTMRHVSRIHRVAPDSLFDRMYTDPKIQVKSVDTRSQLVGTLIRELVSVHISDSRTVGETLRQENGEVQYLLQSVDD